MFLQKNLSDSIKLIYTIRHQTLDEFSEELGIARTSLQKILNGTCNPTMSTVEQIAKGLHVDPTILFLPPDANTYVLSLVINKLSYLAPEDQQIFMIHFQELVSLLNKIDIDT